MNLYWSVAFAQTAKRAGIKPIFSAEMTLEDNSHLTSLVRNQQGRINLCHLITVAQHKMPKGQASLPVVELAQHGTGLICLTGCRQGAITQSLYRRNRVAAYNWLTRYREWFGKERVWVELQHHHLRGDSRRNTALVRLARQAGVGYVATNNVHYATREESHLQDVLVCIRRHTDLDDGQRFPRPNSKYTLKFGSKLLPRFKDYPDALANTLAVADLCDFQLNYSLQDLPVYPTPDNLSATEYLRHLCQTSPRFHYPERVEHELSIIEQAGLSNYFLIVWDIVRYAREHGVRCQGRGSATNSVVAYLLGISPINPVAHDLVFERFLSAVWQIVPDIDIDFDAVLREDVIQYVYER
jgi:error-prone DNA polymerase